MEKFFLGAITLGEIVNIVNDEDIDIPEPMAELSHQARLHGIEELCHKSITGNVIDSHAGAMADGKLADGLQEMSFPQANPAVDE